MGFGYFYGFTTPENCVPLSKSNLRWPELILFEVRQLKYRQIGKKWPLHVKLWAQAFKIAQIWAF